MSLLSRFSKATPGVGVKHHGSEKGALNAAKNSSIPQTDSEPAILPAQFVSHLGAPLGSFHQTFKLSL